MALYDYAAEVDGNLSFKKVDYIRANLRDETGW